MYGPSVTNLPFPQILTGKPPFYRYTRTETIVAAKLRSLGFPTDCDYPVKYTEIWKIVKRCAAFGPVGRPPMVTVVCGLAVHCPDYPNFGSERGGTWHETKEAPPKDDSTSPMCFHSSQHILAYQASSHATLLGPVLLTALTSLRFEGQYMIQVGFNETSLKEGMLIEEIYLLLDGDIQSSEDHICATLGDVFAPFPGIVYTPLQTHYVPIDPPRQGSISRLLELGGKFRTVQDTGHTSGSGGAGGASTSQSEGMGRDNQKTSSGQDAKKQGRQKEGGREPGDEDDSSSDDDDEDPKGKGTDLSAGRRGKKPGHTTRFIKIPFYSSLSIKGICGSQKVTAAASIDIAVRFVLRFEIVWG